MDGVREQREMLKIDPRSEPYTCKCLCKRTKERSHVSPEGRDCLLGLHCAPQV